MPAASAGIPFSSWCVLTWLYTALRSQESLGRGETLEVPHGFVPLLDILVVALGRVVIVLEPVLFASNRNPMHESGYAVEVPVESRAVLPELVAHEGQELPLSGDLCFSCWKTPFTYPPIRFSSFLKNPSNSSKVLLQTNLQPRLYLARLSTVFINQIFFPLPSAQPRRGVSDP